MSMRSMYPTKREMRRWRDEMIAITREVEGLNKRYRTLAGKIDYYCFYGWKTEEEAAKTNGTVK